MDSTAHTATFTKLRTGGWGLKVSAHPSLSIYAGDEVITRRRDGGTETMRVGKILWQSPDRRFAVALIGKGAPAPAPNTPTHVEPVAEPVLQVPGLFQFLSGAIAKGLKQPKLRMVAADGRSELRVSFARKPSMRDCLAVVVADDFRGYIKPDGTLLGRIKFDIDQQQRLLAVSVDPRAEAKRYAVLTSRCSFCNLPLTDEGSIEAGYGPVCAEHWGLPHTCKGTQQPVAPVAQAS